MTEAELTLIVETPDGTMLRRVPAATAVLRTANVGEAVEVSTRSAVARWGLPDFVFEPEIHASGSGVREVGDGLVVVGERAAVLQVKSRNGALGSSAREISWLDKAIGRALRQGAGTIRHLRRGPASFTNARGRAVTIDGSRLNLTSVVIIDHEAVPEGFMPQLTPDQMNEVVLMRRDWEFLFNQLRSTNAVLQYLERVAGSPIALGDEPARYHEYALADLDAIPGPVPVWAEGIGHRESVPLLPLVPAGHGDTNLHMLLRVIIEDIARVPLEDEAERLQVLAQLDRLPVGMRTEFGRVLTGFMERVSEKPGARGDLRVESRVFLSQRHGEASLIFMAASGLTQLSRTMFRVRAMLLHHDHCASSGDPAPMTVAILLTPRGRSGGDWDTTVIRLRDQSTLDEAEVADYRAFVAAGAQAPPTGSRR